MAPWALTPLMVTPTLEPMDDGTRPLPPDMLEAVRRLVEANRLQCLWFMKEDYLPRSTAEAERVLTAIEQHGDRQAWVKAREMREWLSRTTSAAS